MQYAVLVFLGDKCKRKCGILVDNTHQFLQLTRDYDLVIKLIDIHVYCILILLSICILICGLFCLYFIIIALHLRHESSATRLFVQHIR